MNLKISRKSISNIIFAIAVFLVDKFFQTGLEKYFNIFN
jgi:hypothetical protein